MERLEFLIPDVESRPMDLLKHKGKKRQRASSRKTPAESDEEWTWGEGV